MGHVPTKVAGGCLCGRVWYEAEVFLQNGYICHGTICQRSTGQPAEITVLIRAGTLRYPGDEPTYHVSSAHGTRGFCGTCGSRIVWRALAPEDDGLTHVTVGSLDRPREARMTRHICADTQLPWYRVCEELPKLGAEDGDELIRLLRAELRPDGEAGFDTGGTIRRRRRGAWWRRAEMIGCASFVAGHFRWRMSCRSWLSCRFVPHGLRLWRLWVCLAGAGTS